MEVLKNGLFTAWYMQASYCYTFREKLLKTETYDKWRMHGVMNQHITKPFQERGGGLEMKQSRLIEWR